MDIYDTTILCDSCHKETKRTYIDSDGFRMRGWQCSDCEKTWTHPLDEEEHKRFTALKNRDFQVKLRMVGNSYAVSIPKEIIHFTEVRREGRIVKMSMDSPEKVTIFFTKTTKKIVRR